MHPLIHTFLAWQILHLWIQVVLPWMYQVVARHRHENAMAHICNENVLMTIEMLANTLEALYTQASAHGMPYHDMTRRTIADRISLARELLAARRGAPEPEPIVVMLGNTWPFDAQGKVKL